MKASCYRYYSLPVTAKYINLAMPVIELAKHFGITEKELHLLLPSGRYPIFRSRVSWAKTYLAKAHLLEVPIRGIFRITQRGSEVLQQNISKIDNEFLRQYPEFLEFQRRPNVEPSTKTEKGTKSIKSEPKPVAQEEQTPDEILGNAYLELQRSLAQDILKQIEQCTPHFFEIVVVDLLVAMGYGGGIKDAAQVVGKSGDEGINGIIKEDRLGLDTIYIQAKKWKNSNPVSRSEVQKFVGALQGRHASKGIFIHHCKVRRIGTRVCKKSQLQSSSYRRRIARKIYD